MTWQRMLGWAWFFAIPAALFFSLWMQSRTRRQDRRQDLATQQIYAVLTIWAEHWGDPPETVKPLLLKALGK